MKGRVVLVLASACLTLALATPALASPPRGPVTILTATSFVEFPFHGTFEVIQGADLLGCSAGTFVDHPAGFAPPAKGDIAKIFTCEEGGVGTFTANFQPTPKPGPGDLNGHWNFTGAAGDFAGLHGEGDWSVVRPSPDSGVGTLTGIVHYEP